MNIRQKERIFFFTHAITIFSLFRYSVCDEKIRIDANKRNRDIRWNWSFSVIIYSFESRALWIFNNVLAYGRWVIIWSLCEKSFRIILPERRLLVDSRRVWMNRGCSMSRTLSALWDSIHSCVDSTPTWRMSTRSYCGFCVQVYVT